MKTYAIVLLLISSAAAAQNNYNFANAITWQRSALMLEVPDSVSVRTLTMLGRLDIEPVPELSGVLPSEYNWTRAVRYEESLKRLALGFRRIDANGREMLPDIITELSMKVISRNMQFRF